MPDINVRCLSGFTEAYQRRCVFFKSVLRGKNFFILRHLTVVGIPYVLKKLRIDIRVVIRVGLNTKV